MYIHINVCIYIHITHLCDLIRTINQIVAMRGFGKRSTTHCNALQHTTTQCNTHYKSSRFNERLLASTRSPRHTWYHSMWVAAISTLPT